MKPSLVKDVLLSVDARVRAIVGSYGPLLHLQPMPTAWELQHAGVFWTFFLESWNEGHMPSVVSAWKQHASNELQGLPQGSRQTVAGRVRRFGAKGQLFEFLCARLATRCAARFGVH